MESTQSPIDDTDERGTTLHYVIEIGEVRKFITACMLKAGVFEEEHAAQHADLLIAADLRGHFSHGVQRLGVYMRDVSQGRISRHGKPSILKQKGSTAWVDGGNCLGAVVGNFCTSLAIQLAREHGVGWVVTRNSNHFGICAHYTLRMAREGMLGMTFTNTSPCVVPTRALRTPALGTNPLSVAAGHEGGELFALDMSTSSVSMGKVQVAAKQGHHHESIPTTWGVDSEGCLATRPVDILHGGSLLPLGGDERSGGYKGTGLSTMVEVLCGITAGGNYATKIRRWMKAEETAAEANGSASQPEATVMSSECNQIANQERVSNLAANLSQCFIAVDVEECFAPQFNARLGDLLSTLRSIEPADASEPVMVAGDPEAIHTQMCAQAGGVVYASAIIKIIEDLAMEHDVEMPRYKSHTTK